RRRHTRFSRDWSSDVCSSDLAGFETGDHDVSGAYQLMTNCSVVGICEIKGYGTFSPVYRTEIGGTVITDFTRNAPTAGHIATRPGIFNLDYIRAQLRHKLANTWSGQH